jgi:hypothetical protein
MLLCCLVLPVVEAHGRLTRIRAGGSTVSTRKGPGYEHDPVGGSSVVEFVCRNPKGTPTIELTAGATLEAEWEFSAAHVGDCALFISYDFTKYFKIANFPECNKNNNEFVPVNLPSWLPAGVAVVRWDWYALHVFPTVEFYSQCVDVTIVTTNPDPISLTELATKSYSIISPPVYPADGRSGDYRNAFDQRNPWFMTGPDCIDGVTGNCCDTSLYAYGKSYGDCASTGTSVVGDASTYPGTAPTKAPTTPTVGSMCVVYIVVSGDTLEGIAAQKRAAGCEVTASKIADFNSLSVTARDSIEIGDNFIIPCPDNCCTDSSCDAQDAEKAAAASSATKAAVEAAKRETTATPLESGDGAAALGGYKAAVGVLAALVVVLLGAVFVLYRRTALSSAARSGPITVASKRGKQGVLANKARWLTSKGSAEWELRGAVGGQEQAAQASSSAAASQSVGAPPGAASRGPVSEQAVAERRPSGGAFVV